MWRKQQEAAGAATAGSAKASSSVPSNGQPGRGVANGTLVDSLTTIAAVESNGNGSGINAGSSEAGEKAKRLNPIKRKQMQERYREIEEDIARVEASIAISEAGLLNFVSPEETRRKNLELESQRLELEQLMSEWEELGLVLEG